METICICFQIIKNLLLCHIGHSHWSRNSLTVLISLIFFIILSGITTSFFVYNNLLLYFIQEALITIFLVFVGRFIATLNTFTCKFLYPVTKSPPKHFSLNTKYNRTYLSNLESKNEQVLKNRSAINKLLAYPILDYCV